MVDQALGALDHELRDLGQSAGPVEPDGQVLDGFEPGGQRADRLVQAVVADRRRELVGQAAGERRLLGRPVVDLVVVQREQAERLVAEDHRGEAQAPDPVADIAVADVARGIDDDVAQDHDVAFPDRGQPGRRRIGLERRHPGDDLAVEPVLGGEAERVAAPRVVQPDAHSRQAEQADGIDHDIGDDRLEVESSADLGGQLLQGIGAGQRVPGDLPAGIGRVPASEPGAQIGRPDEWFVARPRDRRQASALAPGAGRAAGDAGGRRDLLEAEQWIVVGRLVGEGHRVWSESSRMVWPRQGDASRAALGRTVRCGRVRAR